MKKSLKYQTKLQPWTGNFQKDEFDPTRYLILYPSTIVVLVPTLVPPKGAAATPLGSHL